jgi:hypothetical protein
MTRRKTVIVPLACAASQDRHRNAWLEEVNNREKRVRIDKEALRVAASPPLAPPRGTPSTAASLNTLLSHREAV